MIAFHADDTEITRCHLCEEPILEIGDAFLHLNNCEVPTLPLWFFAHSQCSDNDGNAGGLYAIDLPRIVAPNDPPGGYTTDSLEGWRTHMRAKRWFTPAMERALDAAHELAVRLKTTGAPS